MTGPLLAQTVGLTQTVAAASPSATTTNDSARMVALQLEALIQLQTQQQATLKSLEETRQEIAAMLAVSLSNNLAQFSAMTETLTSQRAADVKVIRNSNRLLLAVVVALCGWMIVSILVLNLSSIRVISRLTEVFSPSASLPGTEAQAFADARAAQKQMRLSPGKEGQRQFGNALIQLQSRIQSLEHLANKSRLDAIPPASRSAATTPSTDGKTPPPSRAP
ncbi:MAG: hypothetical protein MUF81_15500 [Verrucomicrobia bacterium]|jgi:hypothetical protein|nr:hypothetical protein [Verrucomicrobiota bacterium]